MKKHSLKEMLSEAKKTMRNAYNRYSGFFVGACILADDDHLYTGCNIENASYGLTICAESSAICAMINAGAKRIIEIVIITGSDQIVPPCGSCRQRIREFADPHVKIHMFNNSGQHETMTLGELLPKSFGPECLEE